MKELRIVIVEPIYQVNLGYIARICKNFGVRRLNLVNPRCKYKGNEAIKYSKHARGLLENAVVFKSIAQATKGTFVVGTTALWRKTGKAFYNVYTPDKLLQLTKKNKISRLSVLIGRDNTGLTKEELAGCDATVFIPTDGEYSALNISHALAIILYSFSDYLVKTGKDMESNAADYKDIERISKLFKMIISKRKDIRDKRAVTMAFDHLIKRSAPTKKELAALSVALSPKHLSA
jgi:TrmH family RNA methyltransferase